MLVHLRRSLVMSVICLVFFGFVYAFAGTGVAQVLFKFQADGSMTKNGSLLIGQNWSSPKWFHGRPDDTGPYSVKANNDVAHGDNPLVANGVAGESAATNLGPRNHYLKEYTIDLVKYWHKLGVNPTIDLVTTSGSGYDPDISAMDATVQIPMITKNTGVSVSQLKTLIRQQTHPAQWGFMGSSYIDVLQLNEGLAKLEK
jgi:potassium-transporting ATPase KdpC subunit